MPRSRLCSKPCHRTHKYVKPHLPLWTVEWRVRGGKKNNYNIVLCTLWLCSPRFCVARLWSVYHIDITIKMHFVPSLLGLKHPSKSYTSTQSPWRLVRRTYQIATFLLRSSRTEKGEMEWALGKLPSSWAGTPPGSNAFHSVSSEMVQVGGFAPKGSICAAAELRPQAKRTGQPEVSLELAKGRAIIIWPLIANHVIN